eukprot:PITA_02361
MDVSYDWELNLSTNFEPTSFKEASSHDEWKERMQKEYDALIKNGTWKLVDPPLGTKPIRCKWVYKNKYKAYGSLDKHKARLVAKECNPLTTPMEQNLKLTSIEGKEFEDATKYRQLVGSLNYQTFRLLLESSSVPADSTTEAEYVAAAEAIKEIVWLKKILEDLQVKQVQSTPLMIDNTSTIKSAKNPKFHDRTKRINTKYHLIRHHVEAKTIHLRHCSTNEQIAKIFTKVLGREKLERFRTMLGLTNIPSN